MQASSLGGIMQADSICVVVFVLLFIISIHGDNPQR